MISLMIKIMNDIDKCKNQGYNENHFCNISNFSKIHHQAERKIITN